MCCPLTRYPYKSHPDDKSSLGIIFFSFYVLFCNLFIRRLGVEEVRGGRRHENVVSFCFTTAALSFMITLKVLPTTLMGARISHYRDISLRVCQMEISQVILTFWTTRHFFIIFIHLFCAFFLFSFSVYRALIWLTSQDARLFLVSF